MGKVSDILNDGTWFEIPLANNSTTQMKRIVLAVIIGVASFSSIKASAQINLNINIGSQPAWGPAGYDHVDNYYLPDVDSYYNVSSQNYTYLVNGKWVSKRTLPARYSNYNLYNGYKVVMNKPNPYLNHAQNLKQYGKYKNYHGKQGNIRDSKDKRYMAARNNRPGQNVNPRSNERSQMKGRAGHGQGHGKDNQKGNNNNQPQRGGRER